MKRITVICTPEEYSFLKERAGAVPLSRWIKLMLIPKDLCLAPESAPKNFAATCQHGVGEGYRCWQCGGTAKIRASHVR